MIVFPIGLMRKSRNIVKCLTNQCSIRLFTTVMHRCQGHAVDYMTSGDLYELDLADTMAALCVVYSGAC